MGADADHGERGQDGNDGAAALARYRRSIDNIDAALIHMLAERFRCTQAVGALKARHGMPPADKHREAEQIARLRRLAVDSRLDPDFAEKFLAFVVREVIRHHEAAAATHEAGMRRAESAETNAPVRAGASANATASARADAIAG